MSNLSGGWATIFSPNNPAVELPEELTRKWWDKKKQVIAKTHATGMGEELDKLHKAFLKIEWFNLSENPNACKLDIERAGKFSASGEMKGFCTQLREVRDLAKSEAVILKKGLTKKTGEALEEINKMADQVLDACSANSLERSLKAAIEAWDKTIKQKFIKLAGPVLDGVALLNKKLPGEESMMVSALKGYIANPELKFGDISSQSALGNRIRDMCRDMTTQLGNLAKNVKAGVPFSNYDGNKIDTLYKQLSSIADSKSADEFMKNLDTKATIVLVNRVAQSGRLFKTLTQDIRIA